MSTVRMLALGLAAVPLLYGVPVLYWTARLARCELIGWSTVAVVWTQLTLALVWSVLLVLDIGRSWRWLSGAGVFVLGAGFALVSTVRARRRHRR